MPSTCDYVSIRTVLSYRSVFDRAVWHELFHLFILLAAILLLYIEKNSEKWEFGSKENIELKY